MMQALPRATLWRSSCPVVMKDLLPCAQGTAETCSGTLTLALSPISEFSRVFDVAAASWDEKETLSLQGPLREGAENIVTLSFLNAFYETGGGRYLRLDRLGGHRDGEDTVALVAKELEESEPLQRVQLSGGRSFRACIVRALLEVPVEIPSAGRLRD